MRKAIATVCMSGTLADKLAAAAEAGFDGVEIFENDLTYFDGTPEDVRALAASLGLEIVALQPFRDFEGLPEPLRARAFARARRKFELMQRLGTKLLLVCSSISPDAIDEFRKIESKAEPRKESPIIRLTTGELARLLDQRRPHVLATLTRQSGNTPGDAKRNLENVISLFQLFDTFTLSQRGADGQGARCAGIHQTLRMLAKGRKITL